MSVCVRHVPVALHFHLSSERMALAGARKAKALAWNNGSLEAKHTQKHNHSQEQLVLTHTLKHSCSLETSILQDR